MATTSYGKITIIDVTDVGNFSVYPYANGPNTQIYSEETQTHYPNWETGSHLVLTPVVTYAGQDKTTEATVNWYLKTDLTHPITNGFNSTTKTLTISTNIPTANTYIVYVVKASYYTETGAFVEAEGEITFSLLTQPSSIKNVSISGTNVIKYASDSNTPVPSQVTLTATLTGGQHITGDGWKYWNGSAWKPDGGSYITTGNPTGLTVNGTQLTVTASYNNSAAYFNADSARFKYVAHATEDNTDIYEDIFTVFQLRDGASGSALIRMDLTNDDQLVPINAGGTPQWSAIGNLASTTVYVYSGRDNITSDCSITATLNNVSVDLYQDITNSATKYSGNWTSGDPLPAGYYTVKVTGFTNNATSGSIYFSSTIQGLNYSETFSLVGAPAGADGQTPTIYTLEFPSIPALVNNPTGSAASQTLEDNWSYSPDRLRIKAYKITTDQNGVSTRSAYVENNTGARVWYKPNIINNVPATGNSEWGSLDLDSSGEGTLIAASKLLADYSPYTFRLVGPSQSNVAANIKDEESINIVTDGYVGNAGNNGNDGDDALSLLLTNENFTLSTTNANKTRAQVVTTDYQGYKGIATNSSFSLKRSGSNIVGGTSYDCKVGTTTNNSLITVTEDTSNRRITITFAANQTVAKGTTGTITLHFKYTGVTPNLDIDKVITWEAKPDAIDGSPGAPAVYLTFEYGGDKTTYFKNENGTTKVTPQLIQDGTNILDSSYTVEWRDLITNNTLTGADIDNDGITAIIDASDIAGVGSYSCTVSKDGKSYVQYVSFTDYSDPLQVELISTIGDKLTNGIGEGIVYPQTTRDGVILDQISTNSLVVWGATSAPTDPAEGDFYFNTNSSSLFLYEWTSGAWTQRYNYDQIFVLSNSGSSNPIVVRDLNTSNHKYSTIATPSTLSYVWSFRDIEGNVVSPGSLTDLKVSYINGTTSPSATSTKVTGGQFIYVNKNVVSKKLVILCQVTKN